MTQNRPRVLAIAEAANPEWVSVPLVGWSLAHALREVADVHLVTQIRNKEAVLRAGYVEDDDVSFIDSEAFARPFFHLAEKLRMGQGKGWTMVQAINALAYPHFERMVWARFGADIQAGKWDIVHRITPLSPTISSPIAPKIAKASVPFVLGPLNGGVPWPKEFDAERRAEREYLSYVRSAYKLLPGRARTLTAASVVLAGSHHTASEVPAKFADKLIYLPENAIDPTRFNRVSQPETGMLRAAFVGRLVPYKGADMLLAAAEPFLEAGTLELDIIGDGPQMQHLRAMVGTSKAVTFHGWQAHEDVQAILSEAHVFAFPSIREFGGGVVLEAMALGVPPLIVDYAGPGELVTPEVGIKLPIGPRAAIIKSLREALRDVIKKPERLAHMATAARAKVDRDFTWSAKARQVSKVYDWLQTGGEKPSLL
ncbi:MAG: glycosyltransferase family 4 protein [Marinovum sp.]|nr:glycosyltransferase family 4 protein [Marinovum sp.]